MADPRHNILVVTDFLNRYRGHFAYTEGADRMEGERMTWAEAQRLLENGGTLTGDCTASISDIDDWSGLGDPNGLGFDGEGFTGTMMAHLPRISEAQIHLGSIGIYGNAPGVHAIMALENYRGDATSVWSHGVAYAGITTLGAINSGFVGVPLTWYAIQSLLPGTPKSMHYDRFDASQIHLPYGKNCERVVVENYDRYRKHPIINRRNLRENRLNLIALRNRIETNLVKFPNPELTPGRKWRSAQIQLRINNKVVKPS